MHAIAQSYQPKEMLALLGQGADHEEFLEL